MSDAETRAHPAARQDGETAPAAAPSPGNGLDVRSASLFVLAALAVVYTLRYASAVFVPVVLGVLISYALEPLVAGLERLRIHRAIGAGLVVASLVAALGAAAYSLQDEAMTIVEDLPQAARKLRATLRREGTGPLQKVQKAVSEIEKTAAQATGEEPAFRGGGQAPVAEATVSLRDYLLWGSMGVLGVLGQLVILVFLVYFLLLSGDLYKRKLVRMAGPSLSSKKTTVEILAEIDTHIQRFLLVELGTAVLVGLATWLALRGMGFEQAPVWGIAAGAFNSIPYFGPVIVTGGLAMVAFLQFGTLRMTFYVVGVVLLITTLEGWLLRPPLLGKAARMNHLAVFVGLLFWGWLWGVVGVLLAVPMMTVIKAVCDHVEILQPLGELLGE